MDELTKMTERKQPVPKPLSRRSMILTTAAIIFGNIAFGCTLNSYGPVLVHMKSKYNTTINDISLIFTLMTIPYCIGAITFGILSKYLNRQLIVIGSLTGMAFAMYMTPHCSTKMIFFAVGAILGFSCGIYDSLQLIWIIEIWQHKAGPFIQATNFSYALGTNIPTLIMAPFLDNFDHNNDHNITTTTATSFAQHSIVEESRIFIPFSILGTFNALATAFQIFLFIFYRYRSPPMYTNENFEKIVDAKNIPSQMELETTDNQQRNWYVIRMSTRKLQLFAVTVIFIGAYAGMEVSTFQFLPVYGQYSDLKMTESASVYVLSGLTAMFTVGRLIGIIIIFKVRPALIICVNIILIVIANLILLIWANNNLTMFWIGSMLLGTGYSTVFPSFCAFMEKHMVFTSTISSFIVLTCATVASIYPLILGKLMEKTAVALTYTNFVSIMVCVITLCWCYKLTRKSENRER